MRALLPLFLVISGCAPTAAEVARQESRALSDQQRLDTRLARLVPGKSATCLNDSDRRNGRTEFYGSTILYTVGRDRVFRNDMGGSCVLRGDPILVTRTPGTSLCRGDIVQLIDRASRFPVGSCSYGDFVPYRRAR